MSTQQDIIAEARTWLGTSYAHRGRTKGFAVDCIGIVLGTFKNVGLDVGYRDAPYGRLPGWKLREGMRGHFHTVWEIDGDSLPLDKIEDGDVVTLAWATMPMHTAFLYRDPKSRLYMIHANEQTGSVVEHGLDHHWIDRAKGLYRHRSFVS